MELLREIYERELGLSDRDGSSRRHGTRVWLRRMVRGVVFNTSQEVAILHMANGDYYELPGSELDTAETMGKALKRGAMLAVGASVTVRNEIGLVMEYRDEHELLQFTYGYAAHLTEETPLSEEADEFQQLRWMKLHDAIELLERHRADSYTGKFSQECDLCFLKQMRQEGADE